MTDSGDNKMNRRLNDLRLTPAEPENMVIPPSASTPAQSVSGQLQASSAFPASPPPVSPTRPKLHEHFDCLSDEFFAATMSELAESGTSTTSKGGRKKKSRKAPTNGRSQIASDFLNGRFRMCVRDALMYLLPEALTPRRAQAELARELGVTQAAIHAYREGLSLMSGPQWSWFTCRKRKALQGFGGPTLEARAIAGYCEAMTFARALADTGTRPSKEQLAQLPQAAPIDYVLLKVALSRNWKATVRRSPQGDVLDILFPPETAEALYTTMRSAYPEELLRARIGSAQSLRSRLTPTIREWGRAYAGVVTAVMMDWLLESDHVI